MRFLEGLNETQKACGIEDFCLFLQPEHKWSAQGTIRDLSKRQWSTLC